MIENGLQYVFDENTRVIILGTFPSVQSRDKCYYNNKNNQFWPIISKCFNEGKALENRDERYSCLLKNNIGLWDVIYSCKFECGEKSSLDSKIIKESIVYNDFTILKDKCPKLKYLVFNSKNAQKFFNGYIKEKPERKSWLEHYTYLQPLPSTSSANARINKTEKEAIWINFLRSI